MKTPNKVNIIMVVVPDDIQMPWLQAQAVTRCEDVSKLCKATPAPAKRPLPWLGRGLDKAFEWAGPFGGGLFLFFVLGAVSMGAVCLAHVMAALITQ